MIILIGITLATWNEVNSTELAENMPVEKIPRTIIYLHGCKSILIPLSLTPLSE